MKLRPELLRAIETFLGFVSAKTRKRGLVYQRQRCVLKLTCVTPDQSYSAVVRGGEDYTVSLEFADHAWSADCSCPVGYNCKHAVAALFELREQVGADLNAWAGKADRPPNTQLAHVVPQPPPSPICMRLRTQLGRELNPAEAGFIRKVQQLHANAGLRPLTDYDLGLVAGNHHIYNTWQRLELWIRPPRDDFEFWLYVAWELRRRKAAWPGFMDGITDLNLIAAEMNDRERAKQILQWKHWLQQVAGPAPAAESGTLELRLAIHPTEALPSLVVCPKSVTDNWRTEAERFYAGLRVRIWRGEPAAELAAARETADLIVLNYAQLRQLSPAIAEVPWQAAILDEAQSIKNPDSQTAQAAGALKADQRLALTGTPIENRLLDLWSILSFAMPGALGNRASFLRRFNAQDDPLARRRLAARVRPFLLRRTKTQVAKDLPDRIEEDLLCEMEGEQQTLYRAELKRAQQLLLGVKSKQQLNAERFNLLTALLRLRQICCHPALVEIGRASCRERVSSPV